MLEVSVDEKGHFNVFKRPPNKEDIELVPFLTSSEDPTMLNLILRKLGDEPVHVATVEVEPGYWIAGIKGYRAEAPGALIS